MSWAKGKTKTPESAPWVKSFKADIDRWREHPAAFVREVFGVEPDAWQTDVLEAFPRCPRMAMKAAKGPGKSCCLAWIAWNFLVTRPFPKVAATSITGKTLADTLWAEMAKWQHRSPMLQACFEWQQSRIFNKEYPETWFMTARAWSASANSEQQADTLAGLHADYILFLLDEAGGIPDSVMATAEAALSSPIEGHLIISGNPTHLEGPLYRACTTEKRLWHVVEITGDPNDPKRSPRISVQWAKEQIEKYGADSPWVMVNVFGRFPAASLNALVGPEDISAAQARVYQERDFARSPKILGVDVARFGDDKSIIFPRQGLVAFKPTVMRGVDGIQGAGRVSRLWEDWDADACMVDDTGGYGAAWIDCLKTLGRVAVPVPFAGKPRDPRYFNKRAEMYFELAKWIKQDGGSIPSIPELAAALTTTTYSFRGDKLLIEPKDTVKERLGYSPDEADALAITFAEPIKARERFPVVAGSRHVVEYDPFREVNKPAQVSRHQSNYDPFSQM